MPITNPYAKPSLALINSQVKQGPSNVVKEKVLVRYMATIPSKNPSNAKQMVQSTSVSTAIQRPMTPMTSTNTKVSVDIPVTKKPSFKAQLKEQIQQLKQKKKLEKERNEWEKRQAAENIRLEVERQRMESILAQRKKQQEEQAELRRLQRINQQQQQQLQINEVKQRKLVNLLRLQHQQELQQLHHQSLLQQQHQYQSQLMLPLKAINPPTTPSQPIVNDVATPPMATIAHPQVTPSPSPPCAKVPRVTDIVSVDPASINRGTPLHPNMPTLQIPSSSPEVYQPFQEIPQEYPLLHYHRSYLSPNAAYSNINRGIYQQPIVPLAPIYKAPEVFSKNILTAPSPYCHTHDMLPTPLTIYKHPHGTFGISLRVDTASVLVESELTQRDIVANILHDLVNTISLTNNQPITTKRRKRRRRMNFCAMMIVDGTKQNIVNSTHKLQLGDVILSIHGVSISGRTFQEACLMFGGGEVSGGGMIQCEISVARRKQEVMSKPVVPIVQQPLVHDMVLSTLFPTKIPFTYNGTTNQVLSGDFRTRELMALVHGMSTVLTHQSRSLGYKAPSALEESMRQIPLREFSHVTLKLTQLNRAFEQNSTEAASKHWKGAPWTDSKRANLRAMPRPIQGCRCGSRDHEYVNHPSCLLYSDLRPLAMISTPPQQAALETSFKDLSALESAYKERFVKVKEEHDKGEEEARFVSEMERIQLATLGKAIFAPSLTAMILSSIVSVSDDFELKAIAAAKAIAKKHISKPSHPSPKVDVDSDDDVPLVSLGKRGATPGPASEGKKQKTDEYHPLEVGFNILFLAKILVHLSKTWGHVYRELGDKDYAWRWEVFQGSQSNQGTNPGEIFLKNPKRPGSLTLENMQFGLNEDLLSRLEVLAFDTTALNSDSDVADAVNKRAAEAAVVVTHLVSPERSGVLDELLSLLRSGIIRKSKHGGAILKKDWSSQVDPLLLDDMLVRWSLDADPENKYSMNNKIRYNLASYWMRLDGAWALSEDMSEVVFIDQEFDEWRQTFEDKAQIKSNAEEGIGKFGI